MGAADDEQPGRHSGDAPAPARPPRPAPAAPPAPRAGRGAGRSPGSGGPTRSPRRPPLSIADSRGIAPGVGAQPQQVALALLDQRGEQRHALPPALTSPSSGPTLLDLARRRARGRARCRYGIARGELVEPLAALARGLGGLLVEHPDDRRGAGRATKSRGPRRRTSPQPQRVGERLEHGVRGAPAGAAIATRRAGERQQPLVEALLLGADSRGRSRTESGGALRAMVGMLVPAACHEPAGRDRSVRRCPVTRRRARSPRGSAPADHVDCDPQRGMRSPEAWRTERRRSRLRATAPVPLAVPGPDARSGTVAARLTSRQRRSSGATPMARGGRSLAPTPTAVTRRRQRPGRPRPTG